MQDRASIKPVVISVVITAVITAVITVGGTYLLNRGFPYPRLMQTSEYSPPFHLRTLRSDYPPFVFSLQYVGEAEYTRRQLLGVRSRQAWMYRLRVANLTKVDVSDVRVSLTLPQSETIGLRSPHTAVTLPDASQLPPGGAWSFESSREQVQSLRFTIPKLASGRAPYLDLAIVSKERPSDSRIIVEVACPEGSFEPLTPMQWERIGWQPAAESGRD